MSWVRVLVLTLGFVAYGKATVVTGGYVDATQTGGSFSLTLADQRVYSGSFYYDDLQYDDRVEAVELDESIGQMFARPDSISGFFTTGSYRRGYQSTFTFTGVHFITSFSTEPLSGIGLATYFPSTAGPMYSLGDNSYIHLQFYADPSALASALPTPEPATPVLLTAGLGLLFFMRKRRAA